MNARYKSFIDTVIVCFIALCLIFIVYFAVKTTVIYSEVSDADKKAEKIYCAVNDWLDNQRSNEIPLSSLPSQVNSQLVFISTEGTRAVFTPQNSDSYKDNLTLELKGYISSQNGNWVAVINQNSMKIEYILWSEDDISEVQIKKYTNLSSKRKVYEDSGNIIGCYYGQ